MLHRHPKPDVEAIRSIVVAELTAAMIRQQRTACDGSMPGHLLAACMWLADKGDFAPTAAEEWFGWTPQQCLRFLYGLTPEQRAEEMRLGERALFESAEPLVDLSLTEVSADPRKAA
jgi:hypothetical protein